MERSDGRCTARSHTYLLNTQNEKKKEKKKKKKEKKELYLLINKQLLINKVSTE